MALPLSCGCYQPTALCAWAFPASHPEDCYVRCFWGPALLSLFLAVGWPVWALGPLALANGLLWLVCVVRSLFCFLLEPKGNLACLQTDASPVCGVSSCLLLLLVAACYQSARGGRCVCLCRSRAFASGLPGGVGPRFGAFDLVGVEYGRASFSGRLLSLPERHAHFWCR